MKKRGMTLALATLMLGGAVASATACSCGGGGEDYDSSNFLTAEQSMEAYGNPYRIVKESITLDIFVPRGDMNPEYSSMKAFQKLSEMTGLKFNFIEATMGEYSIQRTTAWTDNELPDLFLFSNTVQEQVQYSKYGSQAIIPFNDTALEVNGELVGSLIDNYMPNYKALLDSNFGIETTTQAKDVATMSNGLMYSTVSANDVSRDLTYKMWINQTWIDNINTNVPERTLSTIASSYGLTLNKLPDVKDITTIEQLIFVLDAFKRFDANGDGTTDNEVPVSSVQMEYLRNYLMAAYGVVANGVEISNDGSAFAFTPASDAYREYLKTAKYLWDNKLMDSNTFTNQNMKALGTANRLGMFSEAAAYLVVGNDLDGDYEMVGPLTSDYYTGTPLQLGFSYFKPDVAMIPTGTPYVREIARFLDILYSEVGVQLLSYGEEGVDWSWNADQTSWMFNVPSTWTGSQEDYRATITPNVGLGAYVYWSNDFLYKMDDAIIQKLNSESERCYVPYLKDPQPADVILTIEEYTEVSRLNASLDTYVIGMEASFIKGMDNNDVNSDSSWNAYVSKLSSYKYSEIVGYYNAALARRNAK